VKSLACWIGRHTWTTEVDHGEEFRSCSACGKQAGRKGKPPISQDDLTWMKGGPAGP
jgi:hypothetical protein